MSISRTSSIRNPSLILAINTVVLENVHMLLSNKLNYQHVKHILTLMSCVWLMISH